MSLDGQGWVGEWVEGGPAWGSARSCGHRGLGWMWVPARPRRRGCHKKQGRTRLPGALGPAL